VSDTVPPPASSPVTALVGSSADARPMARRGSLRELLGYRQLVAMLVLRELKVRYKRSLFGLAWTMLNPLLLMVVYSVVFTTIMTSPVHDFSIFLLSGLLPWLFLSTALLQGMNAVLGNQDLIRKVRLPQAVFPLSVVGSNLVNFALSLVPLLIVMLVIGHPLTAALLYLPVSALLLTAFAAGITLVFASATVFFRDVRHLVEVLLQIVFYLSPVLYDATQISTGKQWWSDFFRAELALNPITYLLPLVRDPVYLGRLPALQTQGIAAAWSLGAFAVGLLIFRRLEPRHIHHF
jgi:ABC-type polysaccharide/polyol phosphate export permease